MNPRSTTDLFRVGLAWPLLLVLLAACANQPPIEDDKPAAPYDVTSRAARAAFDAGRYRQSVDLYTQSLDQALAGDNQAGIVTARYNLAVALLNNGKYGEALQAITQARAELERSGLQPGSDLLLAEATLLYHNGDLDSAWQMTERLLSLSPPISPETADATWFLQGLIAFPRQQSAELAAASQHLAIARDPLGTADYQELLGYQSYLQQDYAQAVTRFDYASVLRNGAGNYRGMARALAMAGDASTAAGNKPAAANYFLRAGRSAAVRHQPEAEDWLKQARKLARDSGESEIAQEAAEYLGQTN